VVAVQEKASNTTKNANTPQLLLIELHFCYTVGACWLHSFLFSFPHLCYTLLHLLATRFATLCLLLTFATLLLLTHLLLLHSPTLSYTQLLHFLYTFLHSFATLFVRFSYTFLHSCGTLFPTTLFAHFLYAFPTLVLHSFATLSYTHLVHFFLHFSYTRLLHFLHTFSTLFLHLSYTRLLHFLHTFSTLFLHLSYTHLLHFATLIDYTFATQK
jgi:hypothetical protein